MASLPPDLAAQVGKARVAGGGIYIGYGEYIFMIKKWHYAQIQDRCIILELFVAEARKMVVHEGDKKIDEEPNQPGTDCSTVANFDSEAKLSAPANSRAPVLGLFGYKESDVPDQKVSETLSYVVSDAQPAHGMLIACSTYPKEIRSKKGNYITALKWDCVAKPGEGLNAPDAVKARLEALARSPEEAVAVAQAQLKAAREGGSLAVAVAAPTSSAPALPGAAPALPSVPVVPTAPSVDPLAGWTRHPQNALYMYKDKEVKLEADIRAGK